MVTNEELRQKCDIADFFNFQYDDYVLEDESDDGEQGEKLRGLLQKEPFLLTVSDPYSGYTAIVQPSSKSVDTAQLSDPN